MAAPAQVIEVAVTAKRQPFAFRDPVYDLLLVWVICDQPSRLDAVDLPLDERLVGFYRFPHEDLDALEVRGGERLSDIEVVVEAVVRGRTDRQLCLGEELKHRFGQHVGRRVAHAAQKVGLFFWCEIAEASLLSLG